MKGSRGFTLIELLIALTILAFIGYYTSQSMSDVTQRSKKIQDEMDLSREVKAAARIIKNDISRAFNTRDIYIAVYNEAQRERIREWRKNQQNPGTQTPQSENTDNGGNDENNEEQNQNQSQNPNQTPPPPYEPRTELIVTQFIGEKNRIDLTTLSGTQIRKNVKASDLIEVGYYTDNCRRRGKRDETTNCLWRRLSYYLEGEVDVGGQATVLLEDVTQFELRYLRFRGENVEWIENWKSNQDGDDMTRHQLPLAVQVELEIERPINKQNDEMRTYNVVTYVPVFFTNNDNVKNIMQMNSQGNPLESPLNSGMNSQQNNPNRLDPTSQQNPPQQGLGR